MMTREEASAQIEGLKKYCEDMADSDESGAYVFDLDVQALDIALSALRPVSREQVEKVWSGEWVIGEPDVLGVPIHCSRCGWGSDHADPRKWMDYGGHIFCGHCGAPMTDEAVEMVMERMEALKDGSTTN